jgi:hypothetical protein
MAIGIAANSRSAVGKVDAGGAIGIQLFIQLFIPGGCFQA